jgi:hypothetical protein
VTDWWNSLLLWSSWKMHASFVGNAPSAFADRKLLHLQVEQVYPLSSCLPRTLILVACKCYVALFFSGYSGWMGQVSRFFSPMEMMSFSSFKMILALYCFYFPCTYSYMLHKLGPFCKMCVWTRWIILSYVKFSLLHMCAIPSQVTAAVRRSQKIFFHFPWKFLTSFSTVISVWWCVMLELTSCSLPASS